MTTEPDWWARGIGAAGFALAAVSLAVGRVESRWKRRHAAIEPMRAAVEDLAPSILNANDPQQVRNLFSVAAGSHLKDLEDSIDKVPDRRFRRWLRTLVEALNAVRGARQPDATDGTPAALTEAQLKKLAVASSNLRKVQRRMNKAVQKGGA